MSIFQLIPYDLHHSFFFRMIAVVMKSLGSEELKLFKYALFMILHVESTHAFAHDLNEQMIDIHEGLTSSSYYKNRGEGGIEMEEKRKVKLSNIGLYLN